eukprot:1158836-Pelagomonas_calceolata.AAC.9
MPPTVLPGGHVQEDTSLERELLADEKECAEHVMLVDLGRNDVGKVGLCPQYAGCAEKSRNAGKVGLCS